MAGRNVATASLGLTIKTDADAQLEGLKTAWARRFQEIKQSTEQPLQEIDRRIGQIATGIEKAFTKQMGGPVGPKFFSDLEKANQLLDQLLQKYNQLSDSQRGSTQGVNTLANLGLTREAIAFGQQNAIPNADVLRLRETSQAQYQIRMAEAFNRNQNPYSGTTDYSRLQASLHSDAVREQERVERNLAWNRQADAYTRNMNPYSFGGGLRPLPEDNRMKVISQVNSERQAVQQLAEVYGKLTREKLHETRATIEAMNARGVGGLRIPMMALQEVEQQKRMGIGPNSWSHSLRYGTQNAAFALEDYLISSQYGGPKAGLRAITNNLTAIAAAATGAINPWASAAIIGGIAVAGAGAPLLYDAFTGDSDQRDALNKGFAQARPGVTSGFGSSMVSQDLINRGPQSALNAYLKSAASNREMQIRRADILRSISQGTQQLATTPTSSGEWFEAAMSSVYLGMPGMGSVINFTTGEFQNSNTRRNWKQLTNIDQARKARKEVQDQLDRLGDPAITARDERERLGDLLRENTAFDRDADLRRERRAIQARRTRGELVSPEEDFNLERRLFIREQTRLRNNWQGTPEGLRAQLTNNNQLFEDRQAQMFDVDVPAFNRDLREQQWAVRRRLAGFEIDPRKALMQQAQIGLEQIANDPVLKAMGLTGQMRDGFLKSVARDLANINQTPDAGSVIEAGSAADIRLRQPFFGSREGTKESLETLIRETNRLLGEQKELLKQLKPQAADVGRKK